MGTVDSVISNTIETSNREAIREKRRLNVAKAQAAKKLKADTQRIYEELKAEQWVDGRPPPPPPPTKPPPGLFPDHPDFDAIWKTLVDHAKTDPDVAKIVVGIPALIDQAKAEAAESERARADVPDYLKEHDPIIAIGLQIIDSTLADVVRRVDLDLPLSPLEQSIAKYIKGRRAGAPTTIKQGVDDVVIHVERAIGAHEKAPVDATEAVGVEGGDG